MNTKFSEAKLLFVRQILAVGWLMLIGSAFYDPLSLWLTQPDNFFSPFRTRSDTCVTVQGLCMVQDPYVLAPRLFWSVVVPLSILILLIAGHESWRRICPLSFFSQIPSYLGIGFKVKKVNSITGSVRRELLGVGKDSWLGKNYLYLQMFLFFVGLNVRILFANGSGLGFGIFMLATIGSSIIIGFLFKGKSWCQYFCPMAPVQIFFTGTRGLFSSDAHLDASKITQSMCRVIDERSGSEKSGCVGCQSTCIDIDVQLNYWGTAQQPDRELLFYGYFGLMLGFFAYSYLYSGGWDYYTSGAWSHDPEQLSSLFDPGFYIAGKAIPFPKILAAPLTLGVFTTVSLFIGKKIEDFCQKYFVKQGKKLKIETIKHYCYSAWVFVSFNVFFAFVLKPVSNSLPSTLKLLPNILILAISILWLLKSLNRSKDLYEREHTTARLLRKLQKQDSNWQELLEARQSESLSERDARTLAKFLAPKKPVSK